MKPIDRTEVQNAIDSFAGQDVYLHLETTNGAYATHVDEAFFRQALISVMLLYSMNMGR